MRTKSFKINGQSHDAVLMAGGSGFKIYSYADGLIIDKGRNKILIQENSPQFKTIMRYVNLKYQNLNEQPTIKEEFEAFLKANPMLPSRKSPLKSFTTKKLKEILDDPYLRGTDYGTGKYQGGYDYEARYGRDELENEYNKRLNKQAELREKQMIKDLDEREKALAPLLGKNKKGKVLWYSERDGNGIIVDAKKNEYYFDKSVLKETTIKSDTPVSFEGYLLSNVLCAKNVISQSKKNKKTPIKLEWQIYKALGHEYAYLEIPDFPFYNVKVREESVGFTVTVGDGYKDKEYKIFDKIEDAFQYAEKEFLKMGKEDKDYEVSLKKGNPSWAASEDIWEKAKQQSLKSYGRVSYPFVVYLYKQMGGKVKKKK